MDYAEYLNAKGGVAAPLMGITPVMPLSDVLFDFQHEAVMRALAMGRAALFLDTGLGKTVSQCEWARQIAASIGDGAKVLFVAPLAVAEQTIAEAKKRLGMEIGYSRDGKLAGTFTITNYEMIESFAGHQFDAVVLDESSILKNFTGKTKRQLCAQFEGVRYKLAATATPAPNDLMELGNHSDFLEVMRSTEMLARWFINDASNVGTYRLKGHARNEFWKWVSSWSVSATRPSDLGADFDDARYKLPTLRETIELIEEPVAVNIDTGELFACGEVNLSNMNRVKRSTLPARVAAISEVVNDSEDFHLIWCETNDESAALARAIPDAVEVTGSMSIEAKRSALRAFSNQETRVLISKSSICGFGMNWQHCRKVIFASINFSFEKYYQAVRRSWRFGQEFPVDVVVYLSRQESNLWETISRKQRANLEMKTQMAKAANDKSGPVTSSRYELSSSIQLPAFL